MPVLECQQQGVGITGAAQLSPACADMALHAGSREALAAKPALPGGLFGHDRSPSIGVGPDALGDGGSARLVRRLLTLLPLGLAPQLLGLQLE